MLGVFAAYFITIVIFAGLYLTVNKVGVYYDHSDTTHGGETTESIATIRIRLNVLFVDIS